MGVSILSVNDHSNRQWIQLHKDRPECYLTKQGKGKENKTKNKYQEYQDQNPFDD